MKKLISSLVLIITLTPYFSFAEATPDACFEMNGSTISKYLCKGKLSSVTIPKSINGVDVLEIGRSIFNYDRVLTNVEIPEGVRTISNGAFYGSGLQRINIPDSVTILGANAFMYCRSLSEVKLSKNITRIEEYTFRATALRQIEIPEGVKYIGRYVFDETRLQNVGLPEGLVTIDEGAFRGGKPSTCELTTIEIPESVTNIGDFAFYACPLAKLVVPKNVKKIGAFAFSENGLETILFLGSALEIDTKAFIDNKLDVVEVPEKTVIGYRAFDDWVKIIERP